MFDGLKNLFSTKKIADKKENSTDTIVQIEEIPGIGYSLIKIY